LLKTEVGSAIELTFFRSNIDESAGRGRVEEDQMDNWTFGLTLLIVGMGGTLAALGALAMMMGLLKKIFPVKEESN
jgi:hypothetical protein